MPELKCGVKTDQLQSHPSIQYNDIPRNQFELLHVVVEKCLKLEREITTGRIPLQQPQQVTPLLNGISPN